MNYKVGDKVILKTKEELLKFCHIDNCGAIAPNDRENFYNIAILKNSMSKYLGKTLEIREIVSGEYLNNLYIAYYFQNIPFSWPDWVISEDRMKVSLILKEIENENL